MVGKNFEVSTSLHLFHEECMFGSLRRFCSATATPAAASTMELSVKRLSDKAILPIRSSEGAAGYDLAR